MEQVADIGADTEVADTTDIHRYFHGITPIDHPFVGASTHREGTVMLTPRRAR